MRSGWKHYALLAAIAVLLGVFIGTGGVDVVEQLIEDARSPQVAYMPMPARSTDARGMGAPAFR